MRISRVSGAFGCVAACALLLVVTGAEPLAAQEKYPSQPIELIVPWGPGGGADQLARLTGKLAEPLLSTSIPVVNVPGGAGATGMAKLLAAAADSHAMAIYIADSHALLAGTPADRAAVVSAALAKVAESAEFKTFLQDQYANKDSFIPADKAGLFIKTQLDEMKAFVAAK